MNVFGPGDVTEIDARQVIRTYPKADAHNTEVDDLVQVEFDRPELPWLFTPAAPDGDGRLMPWITLVVAEEDTLIWGQTRGATRVAAIRRDQLQPLEEAWAWAHAQVMGTKPADATGHDLEDRLSDRNAKFNLSRLLCPRRLEAGTSYVACVVPTFSAGNQAGQGVTPDTTLSRRGRRLRGSERHGRPHRSTTPGVSPPARRATSRAWPASSNRSPPRRGRAAPGRRDAAVAAGARSPSTSPGAEMVVEGPIVSLQKTEDAPPADKWPSAADQVWPQAVTDELIQRVNLPDRQANLPPTDRRRPIRRRRWSVRRCTARTIAKQPRIETEEPAASQQPQWFRELNLDPRNRMVGGVGTRVIQAEQEDLMAEAWNQVGDVEAANRALRLAQLAKQLSASLHQRHLATMSEAGLLAATERVHAKVLSEPGRSVWAAVGASSLPPAVTTGAFRRLTRLRGPVVKAAKLAAQPLAVEALTVREDHLTADWVLTYANPDAVEGLGAAARERINVRIAARIAPGVDRDALLGEWDDALKAPGPEEPLSPERVAQGRFDALDVRRGRCTPPCWSSCSPGCRRRSRCARTRMRPPPARPPRSICAPSALRRNSSTSARSRCRSTTRSGWTCRSPTRTRHAGWPSSRSNRFVTGPTGCWT